MRKKQRVLILFERNNKHASYTSKFFQKLEDCLLDEYSEYDVKMEEYTVRNVGPSHTVVGFVSTGRYDEEQVTYNCTFRDIARSIHEQMGEHVTMYFDDETSTPSVLAFNTSTDISVWAGHNMPFEI